MEASESDYVNVHCLICSDVFQRASEQEAALSELDRFRCPACVRDDKRLRWMTGVESSSFTALPLTERLHSLAVAYLDASKALCISLGDSGSPTWPRASVVAFTSYHAVELFLKACIATRAPTGERLHHDIELLQARFVELFPNVRPLYTRWDMRIFQMPADQHYRYSADRQGRAIEGEEIFAPGKWFQWIEEVEQDFRRIWDAVSSFAA